MILSEADAETKWCPFALQMGRATPPNRPEVETNKLNCLAGECMLWAWADAEHTVGSCGLCPIIGER